MFNREDLLGKIFYGIVEAIDINGDGITGKKKGRVKVRIERFHGKKGEQNSIPTSDIPWSNPSLDGRGNTFFTPALEKVVRITFIDGDYYKPIYNSTEHYNYNLQEKLQSLSDDGYKDFYAITYDDKHQYFQDKEMGVMFDYVKSNFNIDPDGNMALNLRDNKAKLYLGTDEAYERIMLGEKWLKWFDTFIENLMGSKGGPYLGNLGAPVIPNPGLLQCINEYLTHRKIKDTFLSDHVYVVDDKQVKAQTRKFDKAQLGDTWNSKYEEKKKTPENRGYTPEEKKPAAEVPKGVPGTNISKNLANSNLPPNPTAEELKKTTKPFDGHENGKLDVNQLTISNHAAKSFPDGEQKYLIDEVSTSLDKWLDAYGTAKNTSWGNVVVSKGYQNFERQENIKEQFGPRSPQPGQDPFGWANQIELYWGVDLTKNSEKEPLIKYLNDSIVTSNPNVEVLDWLIKNGKKYKWRLAGRDGEGNLQFSHWIYDETIIEEVKVEVEKEEVATKKRFSIDVWGLNNYPMESASFRRIYNIHDGGVGIFNGSLDGVKIPPQFLRVSFEDDFGRDLDKQIGYVKFYNSNNELVWNSIEGGLYNPFSKYGVKGFGSYVDDTKFNDITYLIRIDSGKYKMEVTCYPEEGNYIKEEKIITDVVIPKTIIPINSENKSKKK